MVRHLLAIHGLVSFFVHGLLSCGWAFQQVLLAGSHLSADPQINATLDDAAVK